MKLPEAPVLRELGNSESERNLVLSGWLRTYVAASSGVERSVMFRMCEPIVKSLMARCHVVLACMPENADAIYGWVAFEGDVLHYVCVKPRWMRLGIATWMLKDFLSMPVTYTHRTADGMRLAIPDNWVYAPMRRFGLEAA